jgi:hypothetical protein
MKLSLLILALITVMVFTNTPVVYSQGFAAGGKIGLCLSSLSNWDYRSSGSENKERSSLAGLQVSLTGKYNFSELLGLQTELQYSQKGEVTIMTGSTDTTYRVKTIINYLTLPVLFTASHSFDKILIYGNLGPYIGIGLSAKTKIKGPIEGTEKREFKKGDQARFDLGLCIGAGAGYRLGPGDIILDIRYDLGFIDTYSTPDEIKGNNYKATKNRTLGVSIGYIIPLGQE